MDENKTQKVQKSPSRQQSKASPTLHILLRVLTLILTVLLVLAGVLLVLHRDEINLDSIKRYLTYRALERSEEGQGVAFQIETDDNPLYAALSNGLIVCTSNRILLYSDGGNTYIDMEVSLSNPIIQVAGDYALVYDAGGSQLYLIFKRQVIFQYTTESGYALISAQTNQNGWLAVVEQASGYKGAVTVYDASHEAVVTENISSSFVMDAAVSPNNRQLVVLTVGQQDISFASTLTTYNVSDGEQVSAAIVSDSPILEMTWDDSGFWLQEEDGVSLYSTDGQLLGEWQDESLYLCGYSLRGDGFAVEYFSRSKAGAVGQLVVVDSQGEVAASVDVGEEVLSLTAAGRYIALLTTSSLTIYTSDLTEYAQEENDGSIVKALVRSDGTAILISEETASVFLP